MKKKIVKIIMFVFILVFIYSLYNIIIWRNNNKKNEKLKIKTNNILKNDIDPEKALLSVNPDIVGSISVPDTKIDYIVVKGDNNSYYLKHDLNKDYNNAGWIFMDYRNKLDGKDKNIIIYGHDTKDESMFGSLKYTLKSSWFDKNKYVYLTLNDVKYTYEVFSVYETPKEEYYIKTDFNNDFKDFVNTLSKRSVHNFNVSVGENDSILTLSTCSHYGKDRIVLHAKKI